MNAGLILPKALNPFVVLFAVCFVGISYLFAPTLFAFNAKQCWLYLTFVFAFQRNDGFYQSLCEPMTAIALIATVTIVATSLLSYFALRFRCDIAKGVALAAAVASPEAVAYVTIQYFLDRLDMAWGYRMLLPTDRMLLELRKDS